MELLDKKIPYSVRKLIAINSISYCYAELPIDKHCALFGRNNLGKTSLLNALKLHLFPEISFNDCKTKFSFVSSKGELYSTEDSYSYYFPADSSFLILEAENIHGSFCLILFKSNSSFGYERLALPCAYEAIREHFWDITRVDINNGLGSPVNDLGIAKIHALYQDYKAQGAAFLKTSKEIKEKLFTHKPLDKTKGRYCLVPLKEGGVEREISAFRQLMNFTFEIAKTDTKGLAETFATIIESGKINAQDKLHQDLQVILDEYNQLRDEQNKIIASKNYKPAFEQLTQTWQQRSDKLTGYASSYHNYYENLHRILNEQQEKHKKLEPEYNKLEKKENELGLSGSELRNKLSSLNGELKQLNKDLEKLKLKINRFNRIIKDYPTHSHDDIKEILKEFKAEHEDKIISLQNKEAAIDKLTRLTNLKNSRIIDRNKKKQAVEQHKNRLISQTNPHTATVLNNLNPKFSEHIAQASEQQLTTINEFGSLFTLEAERLDFLGVNFINGKIKSSEDVIAQLKTELEDLNADIAKLDKDIQEQNNLTRLTGELSEAKLTELQKELDRVTEDLKICIAIDMTQTEWQGKQADIETIEIKQQKLTRELEDIRGQHEQTLHEKAGTKERLQETRTLLKSLEHLKQRLDKLIVDDLPALKHNQLPVEKITEADIDLLALDKTTLLSLKESLDRQLNDFVQCGVFSLPIAMAYNSYSADQEQSIIQALRNIFDALPARQDTLQSQIIQHNKMTGTKIGELTANRNLITSFVNGLNKQFEGYSISNLKEIRVEIELDHRFEELVAELANANLHTLDIHDDALYQRLNQFCDDFFTSARGNRILEMSKIIKSVKYSYKKEHQDKREEKDQSTGTNALINCTLLTILLRDLLAQDARLTIPVIFDEFTALDEYNQITAIKAATEQGFALFCASPTVTAEVVSVVDYYITLDDFHANTIYDPTGERDVVFHHFWERIYQLA